MEVSHAIHHGVVHVSPAILKIHRLEEIIVRLQSKNIKLRFPSGVFINDEVSPL